MKGVLRHWTWVAPALGLLLIGLGYAAEVPAILVAIVLVACVLAAVHHAELVAHRVGEPFGTFILAIAVTVIELGLIVTLSPRRRKGQRRLPATRFSRP